MTERPADEPKKGGPDAVVVIAAAIAVLAGVRWLALWGSRTRSPVLTWDFYAARSYSLMRPPSTGLRLIRFQERSVAG
jgi:hypothetical protein